TEDRAKLSAKEFAAAAAAFDAKVQGIRSARLEKIRQVDEQFKNLKPLFFSRIEPFFDLVMREFNATVILEKRSVLRSIEGIDITDLLVERVDDAFLASISATEPAAEN
ncbi:MAG: OmpH family outer membrane protein, partial [Planktomarina temperata]|nr:OmpH family outer membrane protein [Planktomarina temperata]